MKRTWTLAWVSPGANHLEIRNRQRRLRWLWPLVRQNRVVSIAGLRIRYTRISEEGRGRRAVIEKKIPGGKGQAIEPGQGFRIALGQAAGERRDIDDGAFFLSREPADPTPFAAEPGDTVEIFDDRGNLLQARVAIRAVNPVHWLNALLWHTRTWLAETANWIWSKFQASSVWMRASSMAYNTILVFVPFSVLILLLFDRLDQGQLAPTFEAAIVRAVSSGGDTTIEFLDHLKDGRLGISTTMFLFGLVSMVLFLQQIGEHLNDMRGSPPRPRSWWRGLLTNLLVFPGVVCVGYLGVKGLVLAEVARAEFVQELTAKTSWPSMETASNFLFWSLVGIGVWIALYLVYYFVPTVRPQGKRTWLSSFATTILLAALVLTLAPLTQTEKFRLFGPLRFVGVGLFGFYLAWVVFFLGAFWAYADRILTPNDPKAGAIHVRFGILIALKDSHSQTVGEIAARIGVDPAIVWSEALALQTHGREEGKPPPIRVGLCSATLQPRISLEDDGQDLLRAALGTPDLLSYLHGVDPDIADELRHRLRLAGEAIGDPTTRIEWEKRQPVTAVRSVIELEERAASRS